MRIWSILMGVALDEGLRSDHPARKLRIETPPARSRRWSPAEVEQFCVASKKEGRSSLKLAVLLAYRLFQREGDVLRLPRASIKQGVTWIRQSKTGALVGVSIDATLRAALDEGDKSSTVLVVSEATKRPYRADHFRHEFARIRKLAGLPKDLRFADLRRSALTEAGEGGATVAELQAVSGHKTLSQLATYVRPTTGMARSAVRKRAKVAKAADRGKP
jgi:Phage integrase family